MWCGCQRGAVARADGGVTGDGHVGQRGHGHVGVGGSRTAVRRRTRHCIGAGSGGMHGRSGAQTTTPHIRGGTRSLHIDGLARTSGI